MKLFQAPSQVFVPPFKDKRAASIPCSWTILVISVVKLVKSATVCLCPLGDNSSHPETFSEVDIQIPRGLVPVSIYD